MILVAVLIWSLIKAIAAFVAFFVIFFTGLVSFELVKEWIKGKKNERS